VPRTARLARLDAELVRRGLARSREQAVDLIAAGRVQVRGVIARKAATSVAADVSLRVTGDTADPGYASRGAFKLAGALSDFGGPEIENRRCLDAGASTGGFTDVLLRSGAREVVAVDVGYGQLAWNLRSDERVTVLDRTNVRTLTTESIDGPVDVTVADLSFISLRLVLESLAACTKPSGDLLPMVKPQFEVGRERLGSGGVVRNPIHRADAVIDVATFAATLGWHPVSVATSSLPGPAGNVEFFLWLRRDADAPDLAAMRATIESGTAQ
jgi:23S rRNA (cytidine1920-2'-O)/16S rRNA (cytidine1409-2'-O)-methyltransferase